MNILENYLQFLNELNKWEKRVASNQMSKQDLYRIRKAKIARDADQFRKGIDRGSDNIIKQTKSRVIDVGKGIPEKSTRLFFLKPKYNIRLPSDPYGGRVGSWMKIKKPEEWKRLKPYIKRHEADETRESSKLYKKYKRKSLGGVELTHRYSSGNFNFDMTVGKHVSPAVLKKEKELTDFTSRMYGDAKKLRQLRGETGEYKFIQNMTNKYINKFNKSIIKIRSGQLNALEKEFHKIRATKIKGMLNKLKVYLQAYKNFIASNPTVVKTAIKTIKI